MTYARVCVCVCVISVSGRWMSTLYCPPFVFVAGNEVHFGASPGTGLDGEYGAMRYNQ